MPVPRMQRRPAAQRRLHAGRDDGRDGHHRHHPGPGRRSTPCPVPQPGPAEAKRSAWPCCCSWRATKPSCATAWSPSKPTTEQLPLPRAQRNALGPDRRRRPAARARLQERRRSPCCWTRTRAVPGAPLRITFGREPVDKPFVLTLASGDCPRRHPRRRRRPLRGGMMRAPALRPRRAAGFTLLEVLVALVIVGTALGASPARRRQPGRQQRRPARADDGDLVGRKPPGADPPRHTNSRQWASALRLSRRATCTWCARKKCSPARTRCCAGSKSACTTSKNPERRIVKLVQLVAP